MAKNKQHRATVNCNLGHRDPSNKQKLLIKGVLGGKTARQAGKEAGYSSDKATYRALKGPTVKPWVRRVSKKMGLDDKTIMSPIFEGLQAVQYSKDGQAYPDYATRLKAHELLIKLLGQYPADKHEVKSEGEQRIIVQIMKFSDAPIGLKATQGTLDNSKVIEREALPRSTDRKEPGQGLTLPVPVEPQIEANRTPETQPQMENKTPGNGPFKS